MKMNIGMSHASAREQVSPTERSTDHTSGGLELGAAADALADGQTAPPRATFR